MSKEIKDELFNDALKQLAVMNMGKADYFAFITKLIDKGIASELYKINE